MRLAHAEETIQHYVDRFEMERFLNDDLLRHLQLFRFPAYSNVYIEEDEQQYFYFLVDGQVQCYHYHLNGKLAVFAVNNPFAAIGDVEILDKERLHSNVIAAQDTIMLGIETDVVHRYGADDPRFLRFLIDQLREKLYRTNSLQVNQVLPLISRLAVYILAQPSSSDDDVIALPGKEELASLLGITPRHLNRVLKELVESGGINPDYPFVRILNKAVLESLAE